MNHSAIIIGGGPAGATCALWLKMLGHNPVLIEKRNQLGGLQTDSPYLNQWVPMLTHGTRGVDVAATIHATIEQHSIAVHLGTEVGEAVRRADGFSVTTTTGHVFDGRYLVLASGVRAASGGLRDAINVLIGPGHKIASADFAGQDVAILGGGDNAFENYLFIKSRGAARITIFARSLRARAEFLAQVPASDIILGEYHVQPSANIVNGQRFDRIAVMYGWEAYLPYMRALPVALNPQGFVLTDAHCETSESGIFAIGEIAQRAHPCCITSMADGVVTAKEIQRRLEQGVVAKFSAMTRRAANAAVSI